MDKTIRVSIYGRSYPLRVREQDEPFTRRVAALVDERIRTMERQAPGHPDLTASVIASLSIAEELLSAREELDALKGELAAARLTSPLPGGDTERLASEADALADRLDAVLGPFTSGDGAIPEGGGTPRGETSRPANPEPSASVSSSPAGRVERAPTGRTASPTEESSDQGRDEAGAASTKPKTP